jgi:hypothetical protein
MDTAGEIIWEVAKGIEAVPDKLAYIKQAVAFVRAKANDKNYCVPPFDFHTFVESPRLLAKAGALWPEVLKEGLEINSGKYTEVVLTGAIGVAKSTLALYTQAYQIYVVSCMANPHAVFDLDTASEILIVFQSINKNLAVDVDYRRFRSMIDNSPYFATEFLLRSLARERHALPPVQHRGEAGGGPRHGGHRPERDRGHPRRAELHGRGRELQAVEGRRPARPGGQELQLHRPPP